MTDKSDGIEQEWSPEHPCYNGHKILEDPTTCERCGRELEQNPIGRWRSVDTGGEADGE